MALTHVELAQLRTNYAELVKRRSLLDALFPAQREAARGLGGNAAVLTPRRGGKTTFAASVLLDDARRNPGCHYPYIALTADSCRRIVWPILKELNEAHKLGMTFSEQDLSWRMPCGSNGKLYGADREDLQPRLLGSKNRIVVVDECAFWRTDLRYFVREILEPTVADHRGYILLVSAPGPILRGYFYSITRPEVEDRIPGWRVHAWDTLDNPFMAEQVKELMTKWALEDPDYQERTWFRRQWKGEWLADDEGNVYMFSAERNSIASQEAAELPCEDHVLGIDTGWSAGMAFVVVGWGKKHPHLVVKESMWQPQMLTDEIARQVNHYRDRYPRLRIVGDPNNAQLLEDLRQRYGVPVEKAEKTDKRAWVRIVNTEYLGGKILVIDPESTNLDLCSELTQLKRKIAPGGKWEEDLSSSDNHCCDAHLYAFRCAHHYRYKEEKKPPEYGSPEWYALQEVKMREQAVKRIQEAKKPRVL